VPGAKSSLPKSSTMLSNQRTGAVLTAGVLVTIVVFLLPSHGIIGRPLIWLSTLMHELGHGITAWLVGGEFHSFEIHWSTSGVARSSRPPGIAEALVPAGGLVGPAIVASVGFVLARRARVAQVSLVIGAAALAILTVLVAGSVLTWCFMLGLAALLTWIAVRRNPEPAQVAMVFLSIELALSVFSRGDYLFVAEAHTARGVYPSDVSKMAEALGGPYWLWGLACGAFSVLALVVGLWLFSRAYPDIGLGRLRGLRSRPKPPR